LTNGHTIQHRRNVGGLISDNDIKALQILLLEEKIVSEQTLYSLPFSLKECVDLEWNFRRFKSFKISFLDNNPNVVKSTCLENWLDSYIDTYDNDLIYINGFAKLLDENKINYTYINNEVRQGIYEIYKKYYFEELHERKDGLEFANEFINRQVLDIFNAKKSNYKDYFIEYHLKKRLKERYIRDLANKYNDNIKNNKIASYINLSIQDIDLLSGYEFEETLKSLFQNMGYSAKVTKSSNDQGADLIIEKLNKKIVVQAKCYSDKVGNSAIQEVVASQNFYKCDSCLVVTNNYFTKAAKDLAKANYVELWDRDKLQENLELYPISQKLI